MTFFDTLSLSIFKILAYTKTESYLEPYQTSTIQIFELSDIQIFSCKKYRPTQSFIFKILTYISFESYLEPRKFYVRRNNNKANSIETEPIVIVHLLPQSDLEKCMYTTIF